MFAKFDEIPSLPVQDIRKNQNVVDKELQRAITLTELAPSPYFSIINNHLVDSNVFAKFDEISSLPVQVIKEKPKCRGLRITKGNNSKRMAPSPYFSIINVHLVDINVFAKFYENPSLPFQDIDKLKRHGRTNTWTEKRTDERTEGRENSIPPHKHSLRGGITMVKLDRN